MVRRAVVALALLALGSVLASTRVVAQPASEVAATGFTFAVNVAFAPDGRMFVADKGGEIRVVRDGRLMREPFATVDAQTGVNEVGLLGIALHPDFEREPWVYAYYSDASEGRNRLVRFRGDGDVAAEREDLLDLLPTTNGWHNGGDLAFGPDGMLYVTVGEGHVPEEAQREGGLGGRILRLDPDGGIPRDNPFGRDDPTYALGIRNSFGICFDARTGQAWSTDNGPSEWDEVNRIEPGGNYGWPVHLGPGGPAGFEAPVVAYEVPVVVTGCAGSATRGGLYVGEGYTGRLHRIVLASDDAAEAETDEIVATFDGGITDVALDPATGDLVVVTPTTIHRVTGVDVGSSRTPSPVSSGATVGPTGPTAGSPPAATGSPSPATSEAPFGALGTGIGLLVAGALAALFVWTRRRAER